MITEQQVVLLRQKLMEGRTQRAAAASAAISERSARKWQRGPLPSEEGEGRDGTPDVGYRMPKAETKEQEKS